MNGFIHADVVSELRNKAQKRKQAEDLLNMDISGIDLRKIPKTSALLEQKFLSMSAIEQFWHERLSEGTTLSDQFEWHTSDDKTRARKIGSCKHATFSLIRNYQSNWCTEVVTSVFFEEFGLFKKSLSKKDGTNKIHFVRKLRIICPGIIAGTRKEQEYTGMAGVLIMPPLEECREAFEKIIQM